MLKGGPGLSGGSSFKEPMETSLAIAASVLVLVLGFALFAVILQSFEKLFILYYTSALAFFLLGAAVSVAAVLGIFSRGVWVLPAIAFVMAMILLGSLLFSIASEERLLYKYRQLQTPLNPVDVEKGLDWKKLEKWLVKNGKNNQ